jgi:uncharacterized surface anchored protein
MRTHSLKSATSAVALSRNSAGAPVSGACFSLFGDAGSGRLGAHVATACDGDDGRADGRTYFFDLEIDSRYVLVETVAPRGMQVGKKISFQKGERQKVVAFTQVAGGRTLTITNVKGTSTTKLPGACFTILRSSGGQWQPMALACDGDDGANDGVTRVKGLTAGTYQVVESLVPSGYRRPATVSVTMGTSSRSLTIQTPRA